MSAATITQRAQAFLAERRRLGFQARTTGYALLSFARFMDRQYPKAPLTIEGMADWARRDKQQRRTPATWARRLKQLRPFARWLRQFESRTGASSAVHLPRGRDRRVTGGRATAHPAGRPSTRDLRDVVRAYRLGWPAGVRSACATRS
jgi:hypothetical protein